MGGEFTRGVKYLSDAWKAKFQETFLDGYRQASQSLPWRDLAVTAPTGRSGQHLIEWTWYQYMGMQRLSADVKLSFPTNVSVTTKTVSYGGGTRFHRDETTLKEMSDGSLALSEVAARHPLKMVCNLLTENPLCYDDVALFGTHKDFYGSDFNNALTKTGLTYDKIQADFDTARTTMLSARGRDGHGLFLGSPMKYAAFFHPENTTVFDAAFNDDIIRGTEIPNHYRKFDVQFIPNPNLADDRWYLAAIVPGLQPFAIAHAEMPTAFKADDSPIPIRTEWTEAKNLQEPYHIFTCDMKIDVVPLNFHAIFRIA